MQTISNPVAAELSIFKHHLFARIRHPQSLPWVTVNSTPYFKTRLQLDRGSFHSVLTEHTNNHLNSFEYSTVKTSDGIQVISSLATSFNV